MISKILNELKAEGVDVTNLNVQTNMTVLSEKYITEVAGGGFFDVFQEFVQNYGDPGPHPNPYWQQIGSK